MEFVNSLDISTQTRVIISNEKLLMMTLVAVLAKQSSFPFLLPSPLLSLHPSLSSPSTLLPPPQDLLRLFGVPFITSPSEAESQCAWLDIHHPQVDGSITDDNDYLLFGGHHVYRHFFNQNRIAELYTNADIHQCLGEWRWREE